ncbi:BCCT family transporter [Listeria booriae]|uniref:glycine betaine uptake BCCT transporter n=1 Tax=Listeria booriae TaxID=1552123 RepID=UPI0016258E7F|nr:BCCT family transporter [Listeria booriae]MBC2158902.1 BCCT family transporter [Listeria booriae]MBC2168526.1 BCCT family transporter [Listeria booriae]
METKKGSSHKITNVFWITLAITLTFVAVGIVAPKGLADVTASVQNFITTTFGWYYLIFVSLLVIFCFYLIVSPIGSIKLGKAGEKPKYSTISWFGMLFSAGMGVGLVFWGATEPLSHYAISSPEVEPGTNQALMDAFRFSFFHWGIHAWAIYAFVGLTLAYFQFRHDKAGLISATLDPLLGKWMKPSVRVTIDVIAVFATIVGVATTLGFGATQINGGLSFLFDIPVDFKVQIIIIAIVTVLFLTSAMSGLGRGMKWLSNTNMVLAVLLMIIVIIVGPTLLTLNMMTDATGAYMQNFVGMSFRTDPVNAAGREWINNWTIFYWAWFISWSPFVGIFIARVSKGRRIREFLAGVILLPTVLSIVWFSVFGTASTSVQRAGFDLTSLKTEEVLFGTFNHMPLGSLLSVIAIFLIGVFFITSADSATYVLGMQTMNGVMNPANRVKFIWGIIQSLIASILLFSGGLEGLQNMLIIVALPFSFIMLLMMLSLSKALRKERRDLGLYIKPKSLRKTNL